MNIDQTRIDILELCSESEYGAWEFWSGKEKAETECLHIVQTITNLVNEKKIVATDGKYVKDQSYKEVPLDVARLEDEVRRSMTPYNVDPDTFYWFYATEKGKKEDLLMRVNDENTDKKMPANL